ncbi:LysR family transcriptional regulator [Wukongibacter baidiensis]|uniref:LysR family transcriptional regulator n=1 Tax=Wukongibacter baidiensis TaxID=1723361 RepID=UPI003D7F232F
MDIKNYITFNRVVETGGFTKAASYMNYAQSTVTLHIKELERHYNELLFDRIGKKIYLTQFGRTLYDRTKILVEDYESVVNMSAGEDGANEVLRLGVYESLLHYRIYDLIQEYKMTYPNVDIIIKHGVCSELRRMVREGELDLTFQVEYETEFSYLNSIILTEERFSFILPKGHGMETMKKKNQTVYLTEKECSYRKLFDNYLNNQGIIKQHTMETGSVEVIKQYVACGLGYSFVPTVTVRDDLSKERFEIVEYNGSERLYTQIAYHKDKHVFNAMTKFLEMLEEYSKEWY